MVMEFFRLFLKILQTHHIPFIFLSAKTEHKDIRQGMDLGADDYLTKPFEEEELISAIESRLAKVAILNKLKEDGKNLLNRKPSAKDQFPAGTKGRGEKIRTTNL